MTPCHGGQDPATAPGVPSGSELSLSDGDPGMYPPLYHPCTTPLPPARLSSLSDGDPGVEAGAPLGQVDAATEGVQYPQSDAEPGGKVQPPSVVVWSTRLALLAAALGWAWRMRSRM